jgi:hypothetical protein
MKTNSWCRLAVGWVAVAIATATLSTNGEASAAPAERGKPTVAKAKPDPNFLATERAASAGVVDNAASRAAYAAVSKRVVSYVDKHGTKYSFAVSTDPSSGDVVLQSNAPRRLVNKLSDAGATPSLRAVQVQTKRKAISDTFNRRDDVPSFWGGAGISAGGGTCSAGYAVKNSAGTRFMVTAGHCWANGTQVRTESGANVFGTVSGRQLPTFNGQPKDMELIGGSSYSGRVYNGGIFSTTSNPVVAAGGASVGYNNYCHSGRTTGENCGHTATSTTATVCTSSGCKTNVIQFTGGVMIQPGDSGGAFYAKDSNNGVWIRGNVIASDGVTGWAESWTKVASTYGVSIVTG